MDNIVMWEFSPFLLEIVTPYIADTVLNCLDYINWCRTSKTTWSPMESLFGGEHMKDFLNACTFRNKALYKITPHVKMYEQIRLLSSLLQTCNIVHEALIDMRKVSKFDFSPIMIKASAGMLQLYPSKFFGHIDIESFNIAHYYIKTKYSWDLSLNKISQPSGATFPLSHKISYLSDSYSVSVTPFSDKMPINKI